MDFWEVLRERRSSRRFKKLPVEEEKISLILEAGNQAPSPANRQPWLFIVIRNRQVKERIRDLAAKTRQEWAEASGWNWLRKYDVEYLVEVPVMICVAGDPTRGGADQFIPGRGESYAHACAAAVENMLLAAQALGLSGVWFTLFAKEELANILGLEPQYDPIALVCLGYNDDPTPQPEKRDYREKVRYLE